MKYSSAVLLFNLCTTIYAHGYETPLGSVHDKSLTCQNGATPKVTCHDTSTDESSCSCKCTNGINLDRPFSYFLQGTGINPPSSDNCEALKEQMEKDANACTVHGADLTSQLDACTLRERDSASQAETCTVRERHSLDQLTACTARENDLVDQLGASTAREKDSATQRDASIARENDLVSQLEACTARENQDKTLIAELEASKQQVVTHAQTIASNAQTIAQLRSQVSKLESSCVRYKHEGCYIDSSKRVLNGASRVGDTSMTTEKCSTICKGYKYFGTEIGQECFCGNSLGGTRVVGNQCNTLCKGNSAQVCGSTWRLSVYQHVV